MKKIYFIVLPLFIIAGVPCAAFATPYDGYATGGDEQIPLQAPGPELSPGMKEAVEDGWMPKPFVVPPQKKLNLPPTPKKLSPEAERNRAIRMRMNESFSRVRSLNSLGSQNEIDATTGKMIENLNGELKKGDVKTFDKNNIPAELFKAFYENKAVFFLGTKLDVGRPLFSKDAAARAPGQRDPLDMRKLLEIGRGQPSTLGDRRGEAMNAPLAGAGGLRSAAGTTNFFSNWGQWAVSAESGFGRREAPSLMPIAASAETAVFLLNQNRFPSWGPTFFPKSGVTVPQGGRGSDIYFTLYSDPVEKVSVMSFGRIVRDDNLLGPSGPRITISPLPDVRKYAEEQKYLDASGKWKYVLGQEAVTPSSSLKKAPPLESLPR